MRNCLQISVQQERKKEEKLYIKPRNKWITLSSSSLKFQAEFLLNCRLGTVKKRDRTFVITMEAREYIKTAVGIDALAGTASPLPKPATTTPCLDHKLVLT